jgi:hypothetical protein
VRNFPSVNDLGLSLGYKVNPKSVAGIGVAYKFGLGTWEKIQFTHEGIGLRSFVDYRISSPDAKMFSNIWVSGGYEINYWQRIYTMSQWRNLAWTRSGLIGLTKRIKAGKKEGKVQVLWDFLHALQSSPAESIRIRIGNNF